MIFMQIQRATYDDLLMNKSSTCLVSQRLLRNASLLHQSSTELPGTSLVSRYAGSKVLAMPVIQDTRFHQSKVCAFVPCGS